MDGSGSICVTRATGHVGHPPAATTRLPVDNPVVTHLVSLGKIPVREVVTPTDIVVIPGFRTGVENTLHRLASVATQRTPDGAVYRYQVIVPVIKVRSPSFQEHEGRQGKADDTRVIHHGIVALCDKHAERSVVDRLFEERPYATGIPFRVHTSLVLQLDRNAPVADGENEVDLPIRSSLREMRDVQTANRPRRPIRKPLSARWPARVVNSGLCANSSGSRGMYSSSQLARSP